MFGRFRSRCHGRLLAFVADTEREGGWPAPSIRVLTRITRRILRQRRSTDLSTIGDKEAKASCVLRIGLSERPLSCAD